MYTEDRATQKKFQMAEDHPYNHTKHHPLLWNVIPSLLLDASPGRDQF
jgi:hypothetical protein